MSTKQDLQAAIAALESQRPLLGDQVVELAIAPLQSQLDALRPQGWISPDEQRLKQVTVMFADIVGSTQMARQLEPEEMQSVLDGALAQFTEIVEQHQGRVLQYAGDNVLAAFGADESHEDDPENAVRSGLACLEQSRHIARQVKRQFALNDFQLRVGINTGRVLIGGGVDADNSIRGLTVHIAARMEQKAPAGGLRLSHYTYRHIRGIFEVSEQPPIAIKGLNEPLKTYLVSACKPRAFHRRQRGIDGVETRMIGRQQEFKQLQQYFECLLQKIDNQPTCPRVVSIVAEAGIGKSRLLYEFENWADTHPQEYYLFKGRAQPQTRHRPYGLLYDMLAWRLQISDSDDAASARTKFCDQLRQWFAPEEMLQVEMLGQLIGLDFSDNPQMAALLKDPQKIRQRGLHTAAQFLHRLSQSGDPLLLIVDDLHWADSDSLDFLDDLLKNHTDTPLLLVVLTRPDLYLHRADWPHTRHSVKIELQPLSADLNSQLARELLHRLDQIPQDFLQLITRSADGNPFYMEELIKMMIDDGVIVSDLEQWRLVPQKIAGLQIPDSLTSVLQARLDTLNPPQRAALQQAAVIGYTFWDNTLAAVDPGSLQYLPQLQQRELITRQPGNRFEDAQKYSFQHHILHQVTYQSLLKTQRENYHAAVAGWFEDLCEKRGGDFPAIAAHHYEQANDWRKAVIFYTQAAQLAAARHSGDATLDYVQRALPRLNANELDLRWKLLSAREQILAKREDRDAHQADIDALLETAQLLSSPRLMAEATLLRAELFCDAGNYRQANDLAMVALQRAQDCKEMEVAARSLEVQAMSLRRMGQFAKARQAAEKGLELARACASLQIEGHLITNLAALFAESGELMQCFKLDEQYLRITQALHDKAGQANAFNTLGDNYLRIGDYQQASAYFEKSITIAHSIGDRIGECVVNLNRAIIANIQANYQQAIELSQQALRIADSGDFKDLQAAIHLQLGLALTGTENFPPAQVALEHSIALFEANGGEHLTMEAIAGLAQLSLQRGELSAACQHAQKVINFLNAGGSLDGTEEPLRIRLIVYRVLEKAKDPMAAPFLLQTRKILLQRADRISDSTLRHAFLNDVPHNHQILLMSQGVSAQRSG